MDLEPSEIEFLVGVNSMPWVAKILFAIIVDNLTMCGSRRKSYLMFACIVNLLGMYCLMLFSAQSGKYFVTACIFMNQVCMTICDAISDALMV